EDGKIVDGGLLGDANGVGSGSVRQKDSGKWQRPRFTRKALMRCCLLRWIISSTGPKEQVVIILFVAVLKQFGILEPMSLEDSSDSDLELATVRHQPEGLEQLQAQTKFTRKELQSLYRGFKNECPSGLVDEETFKTIYSQFFPQGDATTYAHFLFNAFDLDRNGSIRFEDFVIGLSVLLRGSVTEKLNWAFNLYDINKDGYITKEGAPPHDVASVGGAAPIFASGREFWQYLAPTLPPLGEFLAPSETEIVAPELSFVGGRRSALLLGGGRRTALLLGGGHRSALLLDCGRCSAPPLGCGRHVGPFVLAEMLLIMKSIYDMMGRYTYPSVRDEAPSEHVEKFFQKMDRNQDGVVTIEEFIETCQKDENIMSSMQLFENVI
ncbi:hypothetical protein QTP70_029348, partial [Hemibagrus guttatus]